VSGPVFGIDGFGLDFTWLGAENVARLQELAGGLVFSALIACGIASTLGVVAVVAGRCGLPIGDKASSFASGAVTAGLLGGLVLGSVAGAMSHYAGITIGW
jgi:hypothetical protein